MTNVMHQFFSMYLSLFLTLYMFRAHRAHHQERQIVSIQPLVAVTLCQWPCHLQTCEVLMISCLFHRRMRYGSDKNCTENENTHSIFFKNLPFMRQCEKIL
jgi:hypothetical protein